MELHKICRICLKGDLLVSSFEPVSIYTPTFLMRPIEMIEKLQIFKFHIADDLPKMLCQSCLYRLIDAYNLQQLAETSERRLHEYLGTCVESDNSIIGGCDVRNNVADLHTIDTHIVNSGLTSTQVFAQIYGNIDVDAGTDDVLNDVEIDVSSLTRSEPDVSEQSNFDDFQLPSTDADVDVIDVIQNTKQNNFLAIITPDEQINPKRVFSKRLKKTLNTPDECSICGKVFKYSGYLAAHERTHTGEKPFKCKLCRRSFTQSSNLLLHQRTHTGERRYQCELCANFFTTSSNLKAHRLTHTEKRDFECTTCNLTFKTLRELRRHEPVHKSIKDIVCPICEKAFVKSSYLNAHMAAVHRTIKRHKCHECHKYFCNKSNLICHMRIHTGERPFQCKLCAWKFNQSSALVRHMKKHFKSVTNDNDTDKTVVQQLTNNNSYNMSQNSTEIGHESFSYSKTNLIYE